MQEEVRVVLKDQEVVSANSDVSVMTARGFLDALVGKSQYLLPALKWCGTARRV